MPFLTSFRIDPGSYTAPKRPGLAIINDGKPLSVNFPLLNNVDTWGILNFTGNFERFPNLCYFIFALANTSSISLPSLSSAGPMQSRAIFHSMRTGPR